MQPLANALRRSGHAALTADWDSRTGDEGRDALLESLELARAHARQARAPLVVAGWSLGGTAALSLAVMSPESSTVDAVVGLAVDFTAASPLDRSLPVEATRLDRPVWLIHGRQDPVVPPDPAILFAQKHAQCELQLVDSDHAGVIGCEWDASVGRCVPSGDPTAQVGLAAAVAAVDGVTSR